MMVSRPAGAPPLQLSSDREPDTIRNAIDSGIAPADLKTHSNELAAILSLPDELLCDIFYYLMMENPWSKRWTSIIKVCRRWHQVALSDGRLWTWLDDGHFASSADHTHQWAFHLSKGASLSLVLRDAGSRYILERTYNRVALLKLIAFRADLATLLDPFQVLPHLHTLEIETGVRGSDGEEVVEWHLPEFIVQGGTPRLRQLRLANLGFRSLEDFKRLSNLTRLELIASPRIIFTSLPSLHEIYDVIQHSPQLELLNLRHYIAPPAEDQSPFPSSSTTPITLPAMQLLDLSLKCADSSAILGILRLPPTSRISLTALPAYDIPLTAYPQQLKALMVQMRLHIHRNPSIQILRSATLECSQWLNFSFSHLETCPTIIDRDLPDFQFQLWPRSQNENRQILSHITNFLPLDHLNFLDVTAILDDDIRRGHQGGHPWVSLQTWRTLLRLLPPDLAVLIGANNGTITLLRAVIDTMRSSTTVNGKNRQQKRRIRTHGLGSRPLAKLLLKSCLHPELLGRRRRPAEDPYDPEEDQKNLYSTLQQLLDEYTQVETPLKEKGKQLPSLQISDFLHDCRHVFAVADELSAVTGELRLEGRLWDAPSRAGGEQEEGKEELEAAANELFQQLPSQCQWTPYVL